MLDEIRSNMPLRVRPRKAYDARISFENVSEDIPARAASVDDQLARGHDRFDLRCALQILSEDEHAIIVAVYDLDETDSSQGLGHRSANRMTAVLPLWANRISIEKPSGH